MSWLRVNTNKRCPICDKADWCLIGDDGASALCMRVTSDRPFSMSSGEIGYIHKLTEAIKWIKPFNPKPKPKPVTIDCAQLFKVAHSRTTEAMIAKLSKDLGVSEESLSKDNGICAAWFEQSNAWGFPMHDGGYNMIGIRLRCSTTGRKWAVTGSRNGLFYSFKEPDERLVVCEGPTDCAAALSCGMFAVGRASCSSGVNEIKWFLESNRNIKEVVIISDNDAPGIKGALDLQKAIRIKSCVVTLPCKDMREFRKSGGDKVLLSSIVKDQVWSSPQR